jgi:hypothetical protein
LLTNIIIGFRGLRQRYMIRLRLIDGFAYLSKVGILLHDDRIAIVWHHSTGKDTNPLSRSELTRIRTSRLRFAHDFDTSVCIERATRCDTVAIHRRDVLSGYIEWRANILRQNMILALKQIDLLYPAFGYRKVRLIIALNTLSDRLLQRF